MSDAPTPIRSRATTVIALLIAWVSVSLVFFTLSRPVRTWAGEGWGWYMLGAVVLGVLGLAVAVGLWEQRHWWRIRRSEDSW